MYDESSKQKSDQFGQLVDGMLKLCREAKAGEGTARAAALSVVVMTYCMAETIPDAVKKFRDDIPKIEMAIRELFGIVDSIIDRERQQRQ